MVIVCIANMAVLRNSDQYQNSPNFSKQILNSIFSISFGGGGRDDCSKLWIFLIVREVTTE